MIRLLGRSIDHYESCEEESPGSVLECGRDLIDMAKMLSGVENNRANLRIEAERKQRDIYLGKSDLELVSMCLAVPELRRLVLERMAIDAPEVITQAYERQKALADGS